MGYTSKSIVFGGTDEYVTMGNILAFERTDSFSVSAWVKYSGSNYVMVTKLSSGGGWRGYEFYADSNGKLYFTLINTLTTNQLEVQTTNGGINDGNWHHIVVTYAGTSAPTGVIFYVDNAVWSHTTLTNTLTSTIVTTDPFKLGSDGSTFSIGYMDETSVYDKALSASEVTWVYNNKEPRDLYASGAPSNLVAWWRMGEGDVFSTLSDYGPSAVHPTVKDISGNNYSGTMTNMEAGDIASDNPGGNFAKRCLDFGGTDEYVTMGNVLAFERTQAFSVSFWLKTTDISGPYLIAKMSATPTFRGWGVALGTSGELIFVLRNDNATTNRIIVTTVTTGFNNGSWHHVVWTYDGSSTAAGCLCFIDGSSRSLTVTTNALSATIVDTSALFLGAASYGGTPGSFYTGKLDEVAIYNRQLSTTEITWVYNSGVPQDLKVPSAPTWLVAWWRLGENAYPGTMTNMESTDISNNTIYSNAIPVLDYTWRFKNNIDLNTTGTRIGDFRQLLLAIKDSLKTASGWTDSTGTAATLTTPWTVTASSNGTTANTSDNWSSATDLVWANSGTAHSWIILRQTGINGQNAEMCIDLNITSSDFQISLVFSFATGFNVSSPTVTNRPTATDEMIRYSAVSWFGGITTAFSCILNVVVSDGGECTRVFAYVSGSIKSFFSFDKPKIPVSGWANPAVFTVVGNEPTYALLNDGNYGMFRANSLNNWVYWSTEFYVDGAIGQRQTTVSDVTSEWPITKIGLVGGYAAAGNNVYGWHGALSDMWYGDVTLVSGDTYPAVAPLKQFVQIGDLVLPWDRSTPVTT